MSNYKVVIERTINSYITYNIELDSVFSALDQARDAAQKLSSGVLSREDIQKLLSSETNPVGSLTPRIIYTVKQVNKEIEENE